MKIGIIWHGIYPWDVRLEKFIKTFISYGDQVCLVTKGNNKLPSIEVTNYTNYRVLKTPLGHNFTTKLINYPLFINPVWLNYPYKVLRNEMPDILIVRDLPLALVASFIGNKLRIPVIFDMAENYPAALVAYENPLYRPFLFNNAWLPKQYEKHCLRLVDHVFVVAEEQMDRLIRIGISSDKITIVRNTPEIDFFNKQHEADDNNEKEQIDLLYVGKIDVHRGINILVEAIPDIMSEFKNVRVNLVGTGTCKEKLEKLSNSLGLEKVIKFWGWLSLKEIPSFIKNSDICLIPHLKSEHTDTTIPNKIFDYMAFAKPVIVSDCRPLKRIIEENNCGLSFRSGDVADLIRALRELIRDPGRKEKGQNGKKAVISKYNWDVDSKAMFDVFYKYKHTGAYDDRK